MTPVANDIIFDHLDRYVSLGWHVVPTHGVMPAWPSPDDQACACQWLKPCQPGKHPVGYWKDRPAATLIDLIRTRNEYLFNRRSEPNWAVVLGRSGIAALDVDSHRKGPDGQSEFANLLAQYGNLPTVPQDTRGHFIFILPNEAADWPTKIDLAPGVELLTGNAVADHLLYVPPSDHYSGKAYRWLPGLAPWELTIPSVPNWVIDLAGNSLTKRSAVRSRIVSLSGVGMSIGSYDSRAVARAAAYLAVIPGAVSGQGGHNTTFKVACKLVIDFGLSIADALPLMTAWNATCSPPWSESDLLHKLRDAERQPGVRGRLLDSPFRKDQDWPDIDLEIIWPRKSWSHPRSPSSPVPTQGSDSAAVMREFDDLGSEAAFRVAREAEAEAKSEREAVRAIQATEEATRIPPCPHCDKTILQERMNRNHTQLIHTRCHAWKCHTSCALQLKRRWRNCIRQHLGNLKSETVYFAPVTAGRWVTIRQRLSRACAQFFRFSPNGGATSVLVSTKPVVESSEEISTVEALDRLTSLLDGYMGDTQPLSSSAGWRLPSEVRPAGQSRYIRVGKVHDLLTDDEIERFAIENDCRVDEEPTTDSDPRIQRRVRIMTPASWTTDRLRWFYHCLKMGFTEDKYCEPDFDVSEFGETTQTYDGQPVEIDLAVMSP